MNSEKVAGFLETVRDSVTEAGIRSRMADTSDRDRRRIAIVMTDRFLEHEWGNVGPSAHCFYAMIFEAELYDLLKGTALSCDPIPLEEAKAENANGKHGKEWRSFKPLQLASANWDGGRKLGIDLAEQVVREIVNGAKRVGHRTAGVGAEAGQPDRATGSGKRARALNVFSDETAARGSALHQVGTKGALLHPGRRGLVEGTDTV